MKLEIFLVLYPKRANIYFKFIIGYSFYNLILVNPQELINLFFNLFDNLLMYLFLMIIQKN